MKFKHNEPVYSIKLKQHGVYKGSYLEVNSFDSSIEHAVHQLLLDGDFFIITHLDGEFTPGRLRKLDIL